METLTELVAKISVDAANLKKGLSDADKDVTRFGKSVDKETKSIKQSFLEIGKVATVVGVAITAAMTKMIMSFTKVGSELYDLSLKTGVSVEALAGLKYAAEQNGASLGTVEMALRRSSVMMEELKDGTSGAADAFNKMGLSLSDLQGLNPEEQFMKILSGLAGIESQSTRAQVAIALFSRSGTDMLPMLSEGADGLKRYMEQGVKASSWTTEMATLADKLGDSFGTLGTTMGGLFNTIASRVAPALKDLSDKLTAIVGNVTEWIKLNPGLVKAITVAAGVVGILATAIGLASIAVKVLGTTVNLYFGGILLIIGAVVTGVVLLIDWFNRAGIASKKLNDENKAVFDKMSKDITAFYANKRADANKSAKDAIAAINKEYGASTQLSNSLIDKANRVRDNAIRAIDDKEKVARKAHSAAIFRLEEEYRLTLSVEERALQDQIDAIDAQTQAEDNAARIADYKLRIEQSTTSEERARAQAELDRYLLLQNREAEKKSLRDKIQAIRDDYAERTRLANVALQETLDNLNIERDAVELKCAEDIKGYEKTRDALIEIEEEKLTKVLTGLGVEEEALKTSLTNRLTEATTYQLDLESIVHDISQTITTVHVDVYESSGGSTPDKGKIILPPPPGHIPPVLDYGGEYATGGIVPGTGPKMAIVHGGETITPAGETGGITVNISGPLFMEREDQMNQLVDKIRKGIQRQDRLRFGGAFNGG